jgi:hypothetical protein
MTYLNDITFSVTRNSGRAALAGGIEAMMTLLDRAFGAQREGDWRLLPTAANRMPAAASYLRRPGDMHYRAFKLDVLRLRDGIIAEVTTFGPSLFPQFGLPDSVG